jgi:DNA-binding CsgD family transcriptional regulator
MMATGRSRSLPNRQLLLVPLTERELEVLELAAVGMRNRQIAAALRISVKLSSSSLIWPGSTTIWKESGS